MDVTREQVIAYRVAAQGLHRDAATVGELAVLDIGVQEAMGQPASIAFVNRLAEGTAVMPHSIAVGPEHRLAMSWTVRGAPHVHRRKDLDALGAALYPLSEADARGRLNETGPSVQAKGIPALTQYELAVTALRDVVTSPTGKGSVSTEVSRRIPKAMLRACRGCGTSHISDSAMRAATLAAGLEIEPGTAPPVLLPRKSARLPHAPDPTALAKLAAAYLTLLGPATVGEFAGYLEARRADVAQCWPGELAELTVAGRAAQLPADQLEFLRAAPAPELVRLLGPFDPYLQARDRMLIVADKALHKTLWPVLGRPGALFVDGEIVGTWRPKAAGKKLTITVESFATLRPSAWAQIDDEAARIGLARGAADVAVKRVT